MSLVALLIGTALLLTFVIWADDLVRAGLEEKVFYVLLLPLGLCAAAFLFGAMNSYSVYSDKTVNGKVILGGPVVIFVLVVVAGFQLVPKTTPFSVTVFVHESGNRADRLNTGTLKLTYGDLTLSGNIDENGRVTFTSIPRTYLKQTALFFLESEGYQLAEPRREYILERSTMYVPVKIDDALAMIVGSIWDVSGHQPLGDVQVVVDGVITKSDELGTFTLKMPMEKAKTKYSLLVRKEGYEPKRLYYWPKSGEIQIRLKRLE